MAHNHKQIIILLLFSIVSITLCSVTFKPASEDTRETVATTVDGTMMSRWSRNPAPAKSDTEPASAEDHRRATSTCTSTSCPGIPVNLTSSQITTILNAHDALRKSVSPAPASALVNLTWDVNLANIWLRNPLQCQFQHTTNQWRSTIYANSTHKPAYPTTYVGENLAYYAQYTRCTGSTVSSCQKVLTYDINNLLSGWGAEKACYTYSKVGSDICNQTCYQQLYSDGCGHYTQQIWQGSTAIGCLVLNCTQYDISSSQYGFQLVCNYYQGGNYVGQYPYTAKSSKREELVQEVEDVIPESVQEESKREVARV